MGSGDEDCDGFTQVSIDPNNDQNVFMVSNSLMGFDRRREDVARRRRISSARPLSQHLRRCAHPSGSIRRTPTA